MAHSVRDLPFPPTKIQFNDSCSMMFLSEGCKSSFILTCIYGSCEKRDTSDKVIGQSSWLTASLVSCTVGAVGPAKDSDHQLNSNLVLVSQKFHLAR